MVFYRLASFFIAASCLVSVTLASCPPGTDAFYAYIRLDVHTKGTKDLDDVALSNHFSTTFNQMASLSCDVDHRRIHVSQVETSTREVDPNGETKQSIQFKSMVHYKGRSTPGFTSLPSSPKIPTLFGPETFQNAYVEEACECALEGVATTGVDSVTFQTVFETTLAAVAGGSVTVTHVEELAVSAA
jgi:hypothetical protein